MKTACRSESAIGMPQRRISPSRSEKCGCSPNRTATIWRSIASSSVSVPKPLWISIRGHRADELLLRRPTPTGAYSHWQPVGDVCCALCLCLRVHSTTRSYECGWFPNTVCAPDAAQRSSLPPISRNECGRSFLTVCRQYAPGMACAQLPQRRCLLHGHMLRQQTKSFLSLASHHCDVYAEQRRQRRERMCRWSVWGGRSRPRVDRGRTGRMVRFRGAGFANLPLLLFLILRGRPYYSQERY